MYHIWDCMIPYVIIIIIQYNNLYTYIKRVWLYLSTIYIYKNYYIFLANSFYQNKQFYNLINIIFSKCTITLFTLLESLSFSLYLSLSLFLSYTTPFKIQVLHTINTIQTYTHIFKHMCSHLCVIMIINPVIIVCRMLSLPCCHTSH